MRLGKNMKVALLEDNAEQAELVTCWLNESDISVSHHPDCRSFLDAFRKDLFDLAILDWELPDQTGIDVLRQLRVVQGQTLPVIFTTQRDAEEDIVLALNSGADDYLVKPLRKAELLARIAVAQRRTGTLSHDDSTLSIGCITINTVTKEALVEGEMVKLTPKEYGVAVELLQHVGQILSREYLLKRIWGVNAEINTRTVDMHISRVRRSLNINPEMGYRITTIFQHGYRLEKVET